MIAQGLLLLTYGFAASFLWMSLLWLISLKTKNAAIVDVGWGISILLYCLIYFYPIHDWQSKNGWVFIVVAIWAARLSGHLLMDRLIGHAEEGRYKKLREVFKTHITLKFFFFFQAQALFNAILSIPFLIVRLSSYKNHIDSFDLAAIIIVFSSITGEMLADNQLRIFKSNSKNKGKVCDTGLWAYSRHPNYFFEFMIWVGFSFFAISEPYGWIGLVAPLSILWTLLKFTGIPATEEQSLRSRGDLYRSYQKRVSAFVPWFPKK